jgi:hypothetical protein
VTKLWLAAPVVIGVFAWVPFAKHAPPPVPTPAAHIVLTSQQQDSPPLIRPNYRYSLVPYGVEFPEKLQDAVARDQDLADHFKDFDFSKAKFIVLDRDTCAYVSFRKQNKIRWTTQCVMLHKGELILTDGRTMVRARCGNRISYIPQAPFDPVPVDELDRTDAPPNDSPDISRNFEFGNIPPLPPNGPGDVPPTTASNYPPVIPIIPVGTVRTISPVGAGPCCAVIPVSPVAVPELDSGAMLFMCSLVLSGAAHLRQRSHTKRHAKPPSKPR